MTDAGNVLRSIGDKVADINTHINGITQSAREQATGIGEINVAVANLDQITQQNAAMMEETSAQTSALSDIGIRLSSLIDGFKVGAPGEMSRGRSRDRPEMSRVA